MSIHKHVEVCPGPPMDPPDFVGAHWVDSVAKCHYISVGTSAVSDWKKVDIGESFSEVLAPAGQTTTLQTIPLANFCAVKYHICIFNIVQDVQKTMILHGAKKSGGEVEYSSFSVLGDVIAVTTNFLVVGTDAVLEVTNGEAFDLTTRFRTETI
jgi:hypothetical protein